MLHHFTDSVNELYSVIETDCNRVYNGVTEQHEGPPVRHHQQAIAKGRSVPMAGSILSPDVYWRPDPSTGQVDIIADGTILETVSWSEAPGRLNYHRNQAARVCPIGHNPPADWRADGTPIRKRGRRR